MASCLCVGVGMGVGLGVGVGVAVAVGVGAGVAVGVAAGVEAAVAVAVGTRVSAGVGSGDGASGAVEVGGGVTARVGVGCAPGSAGVPVGGADWHAASARSIKARRASVRKGGLQLADVGSLARTGRSSPSPALHGHIFHCGTREGSATGVEERPAVDPLVQGAELPFEAGRGVLEEYPVYRFLARPG